MKREKSRFVCARCGVAVLYGGFLNRDDDGGFWKHANGGGSGVKSCGQPPIVTERGFDRTERSALTSEQEKTTNDNDNESA